MEDPYKFTDIYLEQGLADLESMGMSPEGIANVRKVMKEKMHWAHDAGREVGRTEGAQEAEKAMKVAMDRLYDTL